jgi:glutamate dehydrogenase
MAVLPNKGVILEVIALAKKRFDAQALVHFIPFIELYYVNVSYDTLILRNTDDLLGCAWSHWCLAKSRLPGKHTIHIINPTVDQDGWQSAHTLVQVVTEGMPFVVDSLSMEINRLGIDYEHYINVPGVRIARDKQGILQALALQDKVRGCTVSSELFFCIELPKEHDTAILENIEHQLLRILDDVQAAVGDWGSMKAAMQGVIDRLDGVAGEHGTQVRQVRAFLAWLVKYFTFLGYHEYVRRGKGASTSLRLVSGSSLGVLRQGCEKKEGELSVLPGANQAFSKPEFLLLTKTNTRSTVHRPTYTDYILIRFFDARGYIEQEHRFVGLFTSDAYESEPTTIALIRDKVKQVITLANYAKDPYVTKRLLHIVRQLPRDELFQGSVAELVRVVRGVYDVQGRCKTRLFIREDGYKRYVTCLLYVPRENFNTSLRLKVQTFLAEVFQATDIMAVPSFSESRLAQVYFTLRTDLGALSGYDVRELECKVIALTKSWKDHFFDVLLDHHGEERAYKLLAKYWPSFSVVFRESTDPRVVAIDVEYLELLGSGKALQMNMYRNVLFEGKQRFGLKLFQYGTHLPLSSVLPIIECMGLTINKEQTNCLVFSGKRGCIWYSDFQLEVLPSRPFEFDMQARRTSFLTCLKKVLSGEQENDALNTLVLMAGVDWRDVSLLRAYRKYLKQVRFSLTPSLIQQAFLSHPELARLLIDLFYLRFEPGRGEIGEEALVGCRKQISAALDQVASLDFDRVFRRYEALILATLRTNYFCVDSAEHAFEMISFKFDSTKIPELPLPCPQYEIFVYAPSFEGIHLRADMPKSLKAARGGFRWSDRLDDFRTEVLGLMKAQQVKNALIVPAGAKGGFVLKTLAKDATRQEMQAEAVRCYRLFVQGLLQLTDNLVSGKVVPPEHVVRWDGDDVYLVAAADKGTATFSDLANKIAAEHHFWLGDAFASGGSNGYDHKVMGITSRGAWESVIAHFRTLNLDMSKPFSVIGIGDMSGDVFGNGMLLSENICLLGAFNHRRIFIDPTPDIAASFKERQRLFRLPGSMWSDYNAKLISRGGGVFLRSQKSIPISAQMKDVFGIDEDYLSPNALIRMLLQAKVDLLWNGGIGTYVKSSLEKDVDVGDHANDALRIDGSMVRARVIAEGGNLGLTQLGRVEYALAGGSINADFIDNSGGVDCSDHEVNIKILLQQVMQEGQLTLLKRNELLERLQDEVAQLVLANNQAQNRALSLAQEQQKTFMNLYIRFVDKAEEAGVLDRAVEFLPDNKTLKARVAKGVYFSRPELAVLLSYSKMMLKRRIMEMDIFADPYVQCYLPKFFPKELCASYPKYLEKHYLAHAIIATQMGNCLVTEMGITFVQQLQDELGASFESIVRAYLIVREVYQVEQMFADIEILAKVVSGAMYLELMLAVRALVRRVTRWLLRHYPQQRLQISQHILFFKDGVQVLRERLPHLLQEADQKRYRQRCVAFSSGRVPKAVVQRVALIAFSYPLLNMIMAAKEEQASLLDFSLIYFKVAAFFGLDHVRDLINACPAQTHWDITARVLLKNECDRHQRSLAVLIYQASVGESGLGQHGLQGVVSRWAELHPQLAKRWQGLVQEADTIEAPSFQVLLVLLQELLGLINALA